MPLEWNTNKKWLLNLFCFFLSLSDSSIYQASNYPTSIHAFGMKYK
jgi:hypothetical protein